MKTFTLVSLLAIGGTSAMEILSEDHDTPAVTAELVQKINAAESTWTADFPKRFEGYSVAQFKRLLGTHLPSDKDYNSDLEPPEKMIFPRIGLPENFDSAENWAGCAATINHIRDQSDCGSCWAFASTEAFNDRVCITTGSTTLLSPEETNDCAGLAYGSMGCNGGQPSGAWRFFKTSGVPTGGDYPDIGAGTTCKPYSLETCYHHGENPDNMTACSDIRVIGTPKCTSECSEDSYGTAYGDDKTYAKSSYGVRTVENIMTEIYTNGPVTAAFTVYADFEAYDSGIYQHVTGLPMGGHAVKITGWGVEDGVEYWKVANSWNPTWGEAGFFRILKGSDECGIEGNIVAGEV